MSSQLTNLEFQISFEEMKEICWRMLLIYLIKVQWFNIQFVINPLVRKNKNPPI